MNLSTPLLPKMKPNALLKLADYLRQAQSQLAEANVENPFLDVRILAAKALDLDRAQLLSEMDRLLSANEVSQLQTLVDRRSTREPVGRILGRREFWSLSFGLNEATLEPRPDSETLIEETVSLLKDRQNDFLRFLDLGSGTGCLLLSLLKEFPNSTGLGIDCALRAIQQAETNAQHLGLAERAFFRDGNWLDNVEENFDVIISNPPYVKRGDIQNLMPEVRFHDPFLALDGGEDGLEIYRLLVPQLPERLKPSGLAVLEIGQGQAMVVTELFKQAGFLNITSHNDLSGTARCLIAHHMP